MKQLEKVKATSSNKQTEEKQKGREGRKEEGREYAWKQKEKRQGGK